MDMPYFVQTLESRRLFAAGSLDLTYGLGDGFGTDKITTSSFSIHDTALQPGDRMLIAGVSGSQVFLARYTADGVRDKNFAGTTVVTGLPRGLDSIDLMATQADGKILLFDDASTSGSAEVIRLTVSGKVDGTFGIELVTECEDAIVRTT